MTIGYTTAVCSHNCPDGCGVRVGVENGRVVSLSGDPDHPITRGFLCGKVNRYAERLYSPQRVLTPLRRTGAKGEGKFAPISWDEALGEIAQRFGEIMASDGAEAILPYSYSGSVGRVSMNIGHRFFHALGASRLGRTICSTQAAEGLRYTTGKLLASDIEEIPHSRLIVLWGSNAVSTNLHLMPLIREARRKGARLIVIDPHRNRTARQADWYLPIRPGTDAALALGMMRFIIAEGLCDMAFVDRHTLGFENLRAACEPYTPQHVAHITGLGAGDVTGLAREYGETGASFLRMGLGPTRRRNGGMVARTIACLPALTGAWEHKGGGFLRQAWANGTLNLGHLTAPRPEDPPARTVNMLQLGDALLRLDDPPVKALYVYNSNPAAVTPEQNRVIAGLRREDLFTVVHEQMRTDTVDFADIVLPATTFLEQEDLGAASGTRYVQYSARAIAPLGEARSNLDTFRALAERMEIADPVFSQSFREIVECLLQSDWAPPGGLQLDEFWAGKALRLEPPPHPWREGRLHTPSGKFEFLSGELEALGLPPVPAYEPSPEGNLDNDLKAKYPLQFCTPHAHHLINSSFGEGAASHNGGKPPEILLHPDDARARGLAGGERCRVFNDRGECILTARVSEDVRPGVSVAEAVWWPRFHEGEGNVNRLISAELTDLGGGARFQDCLVEVQALQ